MFVHRHPVIGEIVDVLQFRVHIDIRYLLVFQEGCHLHRIILEQRGKHDSGRLAVNHPAAGFPERFRIILVVEEDGSADIEGGRKFSTCLEPLVDLLPVLPGRIVGKHTGDHPVLPGGKK